MPDDSPAPDDIESVLAQAHAGDARAADVLFPIVYDRLRSMAARHLHGERADHTLRPTALVHEAYLKLVGQDRATWQSAGHFFALAALAMRRVLVTYAQRRAAAKRGGGAATLTLLDGDAAREARPESLLALDEALDRLEAVAERPARVVTMRFFGGLTQEEIADALGVSVPTVQRDWRTARAWLSRALSDPAVLG